MCLETEIQQPSVEYGQLDSIGAASNLGSPLGPKGGGEESVISAR
jgi:hypothetical protein